MDSTEKIFREIEAKLDQTLAESSEALKQQGFSISDLSALTYHYKNAYLSWSVQISQDLAKNSMIERSMVTLTFMEPAQVSSETELQVLARIEKFYPGQSSNFDKKIEFSVAIDHVNAFNLNQLITDTIYKLQEN